MNNEYNIKNDYPYPLGVYYNASGLHVSGVFDTDSKSVGIILYDLNDTLLYRIEFPYSFHMGKVFSVCIEGIKKGTYKYLLFSGNESFSDSYAFCYEKTAYGQCSLNPVKGIVFPFEILKRTYVSNNSIKSYEESILYMLNVRGFTKNSNSGVKYKGTFRGVCEKIPYLQEIGVNGIILMPSYQFDECIANQKVSNYNDLNKHIGDINSDGSCKVDLWGYRDACYYSPKANYSYSENAAVEFSEMIDSFHQVNIDVIMQFYFEPSFPRSQIIEVLRFWRTVYGIDGFFLMGDGVPAYDLSCDPILCETKIITEREDLSSVVSPRKFKNFAYSSDSFMYDLRRFIKGDDNCINQFAGHFRNNGYDRGVLHYICRQDGFRLLDLVSFDKKHNEENGNGGLDGADYNCSWNCGFEGKTKKKSITDIRTKQIKNALLLTLLSYGTPMIYSGDEWADTAEGNNNPYCQDNKTGWVNWTESKLNKEILEFTKNLIKIRKRYILSAVSNTNDNSSNKKELLPTLSLHGNEAWKPELFPYSHSIGFMEKVIDGENGLEEYIYIAVNMHWEECSLGLPKLRDDRAWNFFLSTDLNDYEKYKEKNRIEQSVCVGPRTVIILNTVKKTGDLKKSGKKVK